MAMRNFNVALRPEPLEWVGEPVGKDLFVHRDVTKSHEPARTWAVSIRECGIALLTGIRTRENARRIALELAPSVQDLRAAVAYSKLIADR